MLSVHTLAAVDYVVTEDIDAFVLLLNRQVNVGTFATI